MLNEIIFSDYNISLKKTQYSDFELLTNYLSIKQALMIILLSRKGNRVRYQNPYFGSNLYKLLFEKMNIFTVIQIKEELEISLEVWEPRIKVLEVVVNPDYENNIYNITINYKIIDINIEDSLVLSLDVLK